MKRTEATVRGIFWAGLAGGLASTLPLFSLANWFCFLWAWVTGVLAVVLVRRREPLPDAGAPKVGALAGAYAALVMVTLDVLAMLIGLGGGFDPAEFGEFLPEGMPPEGMALVGWFTESGTMQVLFTLVGGLIVAGVYAALGALGALLYTRLSRHREPPVAQT